MTEDSKSAWRYRPAWMRDEALRSARTCYNHLAGRLGVALAESLGARGYVQLHDDEAGQVGEEGTRFFAELGLDIAGAAGRRCRVPLYRELSHNKRITTRTAVTGQVGCVFQAAGIAG